MLPNHLSEVARAILGKAGERVQAAGYAGAVTPQEAFVLLAEPGVRLIDVRSRAEWVWVGRIPGALHVPWSHFQETGLVRNAAFPEELRACTAPGDILLMLCRSAKRSKPAAQAATAAGYHAFDILEGFEGDPDTQGQRNTKDGWRHNGLPWTQE